LDLIELAKKGNKEAKAIFATVEKRLGEGTANLINVLNPQEIILSGEGVRAGDLLFTPMRNSINENVIAGNLNSHNK